jgi:hypothetical protein
VANKTVIFKSQLYAGTSGLTAFLYAQDGTGPGNGAGDAVTALSNGYFSFVVTEAITGAWDVVVKNGSTAILEGGVIYFESDSLGTYVVDVDLPPVVIPGSGGGARAVTITVNDGTNPIQNATVRMSRSGETLTNTTNVSGVTTFSADDATWTVSITATGFSFTPATLVVTSTESRTYSMTSTGGGLTPSSPTLTTGYWTMFSESGVVIGGIVVDVKVWAVPEGSAGLALLGTTRSVTSAVDGLVEMDNMFPGAQYEVRVRSSGRFAILKVPADAGASVALGSIVG